MTVLGPVPVEEMGVTLMHEHILLDALAPGGNGPAAHPTSAIAEQPVYIEIIGELRMNPLPEPRQLFRSSTSIWRYRELNRFAGLGGHTVVDPTYSASAAIPPLCPHRPHVRPQHRHGHGLSISKHTHPDDG